MDGSLCPLTTYADHLFILLPSLIAQVLLYLCVVWCSFVSVYYFCYFWVLFIL